jgi:hypothetical protein
VQLWAHGTARNKTAELREALRGRITEHHRTMLKLHLQVVDALRHTLAELDAAVGKALAPIPQRTRLLTTMPGVSDLTASVLVAEIGVDMTRFPYLVSCAGLCPRSNESAGKRRSTRVRKSGTWIKTTLVTAAWAAVRVQLMPALRRRRSGYLCDHFDAPVPGRGGCATGARDGLADEGRCSYCLPVVGEIRERRRGRGTAPEGAGSVTSGVAGSTVKSFAWKVHGPRASGGLHGSNLARHCRY